jgi:hypothetical protein
LVVVVAVVAIAIPNPAGFHHSSPSEEAKRIDAMITEAMLV